MGGGEQSVFQKNQHVKYGHQVWEISVRAISISPLSVVRRYSPIIRDTCPSILHGCATFQQLRYAAISPLGLVSTPRLRLQTAEPNVMRIQSVIGFGSHSIDLVCDFMLPPRGKWGLRSSGILHHVMVVRYRRFGNELPALNGQHSNKNFHFVFRKELTTA